VGSSPAATEAVRFGKYSLVARLATGGMAEIFLARLVGAAGFEKLVCIKRILPHLARDKHFVAMFLDEARIAARITHPNVCQVFELGEIEGSYYLAMEYLEGVPLSCFRRHGHDGALPAPRLVAGIAIQACEGLHHAHQLKNSEGRPMELVHRDVSPQNLFVTADGIVKVLDFGIAKIQDATVRTSTGAIKGTYAYMAPEQLRGERVDRRIDVFALGIAMWETLTRRHLFKRDTEFLTFQAITGDPIEDVCALRPDVPPALSAVIMKALSRDRNERFATARVLGEAIAAAVQPLAAPAVSEEIARAFPSQLAEQAELIRVARSGGAFALDSDRGPSVGHDTDLVTTPVSGQARRSSSLELSSLELSSLELSSLDTSSAQRWRADTMSDPSPAPDTAHAGAPTAAGAPAAAAAPAARRGARGVLAFALALAAGGSGVVLYTRLAGDSADRDRGGGSSATAIAPQDAGVVVQRPIEAPAPPAPMQDDAPHDAAVIAAAQDAAQRDEAAHTRAAAPADPRPAAPPRPPRPAPRPSGPPGWITIDSQPWATIYIDGKDYGPTPVGNVALAPGRHSVRAVTPSGATKELSIWIETGKTSAPKRIEW
jgi:serine/threonine protein kinase